MRTFALGAVMMEETFEGYRDLAELFTYWTAVDAAGIAALSLENDGYAAGGQRQHVVMAINNTSGALGTVTLSTQGRASGTWAPNTVLTQVPAELSVRYKADPALAGCALGVRASANFFGQTILADPAICDGEWHTVTGVWFMQDESVGADGYHFIATNIPIGAEGAIAFDDYRITRLANVWREIDNSCPVAFMRADWDTGIKEVFTFPTQVHTARDGSEQREQLRMLPASRLEYSVIADDAVASARIDAWLWANQGRRVAVPRWMDAVPFASTASSGHELFLSDDVTDRWFQRRQRVLIWESPTKWEAPPPIDTITGGIPSRITFDPVEGAVIGTYTPGVAVVVPLVPGRLAPDVALGRPGSHFAEIPLAFTLEMVQ
jgi:hypothetical protein